MMLSPGHPASLNKAQRRSRSRQTGSIRQRLRSHCRCLLAGQISEGDDTRVRLRQSPTYNRFELTRTRRIDERPELQGTIWRRLAAFVVVDCLLVGLTLAVLGLLSATVATSVVDPPAAVWAY